MNIVAALRKPRAGAVEMPPRGKRGKLKKQNEFPTLSTGLGNPAKSESAGFPHFHSAGCRIIYKKGDQEKMNQEPNSS